MIFFTSPFEVSIFTKYIFLNMSREKKSLSNVKIIIDHAALMGHNRH